METLRWKMSVVLDIAILVIPPMVPDAIGRNGIIMVLKTPTQAVPKAQEGKPDRREQPEERETKGPRSLQLQLPPLRPKQLPRPLRLNLQ
jgi:hypothetical protein